MKEEVKLNNPSIPRGIGQGGVGLPICPAFCLKGILTLGITVEDLYLRDPCTIQGKEDEQL